jgi:hypothetical protein
VVSDHVAAKRGSIPSRRPSPRPVQTAVSLGRHDSTMRATICVDVDKPDDRAQVEAWFQRWRDQLTYVSENTGCGCCVDIWDVEGPADAVGEVPVHLRTNSEWADLP